MSAKIVMGIFFCLAAWGDVVATAKSFLGAKYRWGGASPGGFDCSGFTQYVYAKEGVHIPRRAYEQSLLGDPVGLSELRPGDLLFFKTDPQRGLPVTHTGIYIGNGRFIHAASQKKGVVVTLLDQYLNRLVIAKRVTPHPSRAKDNNPFTAPTRLSFTFDGHKYLPTKTPHLSKKEPVCSTF